MLESIRTNVSLREYLTLKVGGEAAYMCEVDSEEEVVAALQFAQANTAVPPLVMGDGSNILCGDDGYPGLVIVMKNAGFEVSADADVVSVIAHAGQNLDEMIEVLCAQGVWGLENLSAIPGTVGATPVQNVGAYGVEVASLITEVTAIHRDMKEKQVFSNDECRFGYRESFFKTEAGREWVIVSVSFLLPQTGPNLSYAGLQELQNHPSLTPSDVREAVIKIRAAKFPDWHTVGTAGSFFKNPIIPRALYEDLLQKYPALPAYEVEADGWVKIPLGWVLDHVCGLRGFRKGNVSLFEKQALVLVADAGATATEVQSFVTFIQEKVKAATGIEIEPEVRYV